MAALNRADINSFKKMEFYADFLDSFSTTPLGNDLGRVTNERAIKQAIRNIILTNIGERPFQPNIGSDVRRSLFEPNGVITDTYLQFLITSAIQNWEPRAHEVLITVRDEDVSLNVNIVFYIINNPEPIDLTINLKRTR